MKKYFYTKIVACVVGCFTLILAIYFCFIAFIGIGLSNSWSAEGRTSITQFAPVFVLFITIFMIGLFTFIGSLRLNSQSWAKFYIVIMILMGIVFIVATFAVWGAIGKKSEILILVIGLLYISLGYIALRKK